MWPILRRGDGILVRPLLETPTLGTVVVFASDNRLICHRLIYTEGEGDQVFYYTRGDGHFAFDPPKRRNDLWGEVIAVEGAPFRSLFLKRLAAPLLRWFWLRDRALKRFGGGPSGRRFSLFYMGLTPWLLLRPRAAQP